MGYHIQEGNYGTATLYAGLMFLDASGVNWLLNDGGKMILRNGARLWADEAGGIMIPRLGAGAAAGATSAASRVTSQLDDVTRNFFGHGQTVTPPVTAPPFSTILNEGGTRLIEVTTRNGQVLEVMFNETWNGTTLTLRAAHVGGSSAGQVGGAELLRLSEQYGRFRGASQIVVEGFE